MTAGGVDRTRAEAELKEGDLSRRPGSRDHRASGACGGVFSHHVHDGAYLGEVSALLAYDQPTMDPRSIAKQVPGALGVVRRARLARKRWERRNLNSVTFWEGIYASGQNSGSGSYGQLGQFKAEVLNDLVVRYDVRSAAELGCGDGEILSKVAYPEYVGLDTSATAVNSCKIRFAGDSSKRFVVYRPGSDPGIVADLALSIDVIYHLLEDSSFEDYMSTLFRMSTRLVVIYSSNVDDVGADCWEVRHRQFTTWVEANASGWHLLERIPQRYPYNPRSASGTSWSDFFVFELTDRAGPEGGADSVAEAAGSNDLRDG